MLSYPITLETDTDGSTLIRFVDFPEPFVSGDDEADALRQADDALEVALDFYIDERKSVPMPSKPQKGQKTVTLPALSTAKVLLWNEMLSQRVRKADLARMLDVQPTLIERLFDLRHSTKLDFIEEAARALGKRIDISLA